MKYFSNILTFSDIEGIKKDFPEYVKISADLENGVIMVGCELHADGEELLIQKGGRSDNIWGGGIDFISNKINTTAVLNIRPRLDNDSMEILDSDRRAKFIELVTKYFEKLWH